MTLAFFAMSFAPASHAATTQSQVEQSLIDAVNEVRVAHGLRPLRVDGALVRAARSNSTTLLRQNVFAHRGALGERIAGFGGRGPAFGENLAWGTGRYASARSIVASWLRSPGHRANLLRPGWDRVGIGARSGRFLGHAGATVVTADFAGR